MDTSLQWPLFMADSPRSDSCLNLSTMATSPQHPLSSFPKVAIVERFNYMYVISAGTVLNFQAKLILRVINCLVL